MSVFTLSRHATTLGISLDVLVKVFMFVALVTPIYHIECTLCRKSSYAIYLLSLNGIDDMGFAYHDILNTNLIPVSYVVFLFYCGNTVTSKFSPVAYAVPWAILNVIPPLWLISQGLDYVSGDAVNAITVHWGFAIYSMFMVPLVQVLPIDYSQSLPKWVI